MAAPSAQDAIADARMVITMLPAADAVESVISADGLPAFTAGAVWAQMGTIGVAATGRLAGDGRNDVSVARLALGDPAGTGG